MTKTISISGKEITLESCPMHVAPGGSIKILFKAPQAELFGFLRELREELAYGLYFIEAGAEELSLGIFFGKADLDAFNSQLESDKAASNWDIDRIDVPESSVEKAYTMASRNALLNV